MHGEAYNAVKEMVEHYENWKSAPVMSVLEFGSRDINGSVRDLFPIAVARNTYVGVDVVPGPGVDVVADATAFWTDDHFDAVVCCELFEHTPYWRKIIENGTKFLWGTGVMIVTAATNPRLPHSATDGENRLIDEEHYENISPEDLEAAFTDAKLLMPRITTHPRGDVYGRAIK